LTKAGAAGRGWEVRVDGEHRVDVGWLRVLQAKRGCPLQVGRGAMDGEDEGKRWTGERGGGTISKQRPEGL
jgi:hypothetical protein